MKSLFILIILFCGISLLAQTIVINELMSSNATTLYDEDGDSSDWIELYNISNSSVNLAGYGISDRDDDPFKWEFPDIEMAANEYLVVFASKKDRDLIAYWETLIDWGDDWKYFVGTQNPPSDWKQIDFDDTSWLSGPTGIGYGYDEATTIPATTSCYLRHNFNIDDVDEVLAGLFHTGYDDGFVAYLNGFEIARVNLGYTGSIPAFDEYALNHHETQIYEGEDPEAFVLSDIQSILLEGENVLSIQIHNTESSGDLLIIPFFTLGYQSIPQNPVGINPLLDFSIPFLHTNFKLKVGEDITLTDAQGNLLDDILIGAIETDISLGRQPDGIGNWFLFTEPTPGGSNNTIAYQEIAGIPEFSQSGGFYSGSQIVELTSENSSQTIHYTLDGSVPIETSVVYTEPIIIDSNLVVRARNFGPGLIPGETVTNTYFIDEDFSLPVISICSDPANFFDEEIGIFAMGDSAEPVFPYYGANFWQDWERPINIELYELDGTSTLNNGAGVKIFGNYSRGHAQKSLAIFARNQYGVSPFECNLFEEKPIAEFEAFILRNSGNDWNFSLFRDALMTGLIADTNLDYQAYRPATIFINGMYWGILNIREKVNEHFLASNNNVVADDLDILEDNASIVQGNDDPYLQMRDFINNNDMSDQANYDYISTQMDIDNFIIYQAVEIYYTNTDWPSRNIKYWRDPTGDGKWRWILYDTDFGMGLANFPNHNTLEFALEPNGPFYPNPPWSTLLLRKMIENDGFKIKFINTFADLMNTNFNSEIIISRINDMHDFLEPEIPNHFERWNGDLPVWENEISQMRQFAEERPVFMTDIIMQKFSLNGTSELNIDIYPPETGKVLINTIMIDEFPWNGTYFMDVPVTLTGVDVPGYKFTGWSGDVISDSTSITIDMNNTYSLIAWFEEFAGNANSVIFNEINYKSADDFDSEDWVEIYNRSDETIDISQWQFKDSKDDHIFNFPQNTEIQSDHYLVLCRDNAAFSVLYPEVTNCIGDFDFGLSSDGEEIRLFDQVGNVIDSLVYGVNQPWPVEPNGNGYTLSLIDPDYDNNFADNWATSSLHGTPGTENDFLQSNPDPEELYISQNYPNPFSNFTLFEYAIPIDGKVKLEIYNIKGQLVKSIINEFKEKGNYMTAWDGNNKYNKPVSSGIYLCSIRVGRLVKTRKLIYIH